MIKFNYSLPASTQRLLVCGAGCTLLVLLASIVFSDSVAVPPPEGGTGADLIYQAVAGESAYRKTQASASFERNGATWTVTGAEADIVNPTLRPDTWPVKGNTYEIQILPRPVTNAKILPYTDPVPNSAAAESLSVRGCPDEYEPASFVVRSGDSDIVNLKIRITGLKQTAGNRKHVIPRDRVDVRTVKCWYQAGDALWDVKHKMLKPELLLHDDRIVRTDLEKQVNLIRNVKRLKDTARLLPFGIPARSNKQVWITIQIPAGTPAGEYAGKVILSADGMEGRTLKLAVSVLPVKLERPKVTSSIFYLTGAYEGNTGRQFKRDSRTRLIEFKDMRAHGIYNPVIELRNFSPQGLNALLKLKRRAGMDKSPLLYTSWPKLPRFEAQKAVMLDTARRVMSHAHRKGIREVYYYGFDEIRGADLQEARPVLEKMKSLGLRTIQTAMTVDTVNTLGDLLDVVIYHGGVLFRRGAPAPETVVGQVHAKHKQIWIYGHPQGGLENPETYRRNYGALIWKHNIDGLCTYAYQCPMKEPWDDWDQTSPAFRDELMVYPTVNGIIPTLQWEGYREAVDDIRYLTTLEKLISGAPAGQARSNAQAWIRDLDPDQDLYEMREQATAHILALQSAGKHPDYKTPDQRH